MTSFACVRLCCRVSHPRLAIITSCCLVNPCHVSSSVALDGFQLVDVGLGRGNPGCCCIVKDWSDNTLVVLCFDMARAARQIPS